MRISAEIMFSPQNRYGDRICLSETVDSKVAPVWTDEGSLHLPAARNTSAIFRQSRRNLPMKRHSQSEDAILDFNDIAEMVNPSRAWGRPRENDLHIQVAAFETSKSLRLTVIGERLQSKVEIGCLEIPLGPALECWTLRQHS